MKLRMPIRRLRRMRHYPHFPPALRTSLSSLPHQNALCVSTLSWSPLLPLTSRSSGHAWYGEDRSIPPNAPLLKDLDSFTDGTGQGSFDFPLPTGADDVALPLIFHPADDYGDIDDVDTPSTATMPNSLALDLLPSPSDPTDGRAGVDRGCVGNNATPVATSELPPKSGGGRSPKTVETDERRLRAWSPIIESATPHEELKQEEIYPFDRAECESPG